MLVLQTDMKDLCENPICLIIPPSPFLLDERVFMSLGILRVAAMLELAEYKVELVDLSGIKNYEDAIRAHVASSEAQIFGLTATTPQLPAATKIAAVIRTARPDARLILGGPHVTLTNAAHKREKKIGVSGRAGKAFAAIADYFDVLVAGDGELAILEALKPNAPKLIDADDPKSSLWLNNDWLSAAPLPARHLVDVDSYHYSIDGFPALSMIAQLGCPFECGFCGGRESPSLRRIRMRSVESIVAEIEHLYRTYGVRGIQMYDDELNVNRGMVGLMRAIEKKAKSLGTEFRLRGFVKSELFNDEQAEAMYSAGFRWILVGFESGSPRMLRNMNKKATREDNTRCMEIARRHGLKVKALMSVGHPGESAETIKETRDWLIAVRPDDFDLTIITTYPGTPYYDQAVLYDADRGVWIYEVNCDRLYSYEVDYSTTENYYKGNPNGGYVSFVYTEWITSTSLVWRRDEVEREVREELGIPYPSSAAGMLYEHSMGQSGLPPNILRRTETEVMCHG